MKKAVIIAAGGKGIRMQADIPKQFLMIEQKPILYYTLQAFYTFDSSMQLIVVLPEDHIAYWEKLIAKTQMNIPHLIAKGGKTRYHSVKNGLSLINDAEIIAVHDAVRPLIDSPFLTRLFATAESKGSAIPVLQATDTIRQIKEKETKVLDRTTIFMVQTPQVFYKEWLWKAYTLPYSPEITDDALLVEKAGFELTFVNGLKSNIKITTPDDLMFVTNWLRTKNTYV